MFQSLPSHEPNPGAYSISEAPYGATTAFPNMGSRKRLQAELTWAGRHKVTRVELSEDLDRDAVRQVAGRFAGQDCLYVVTTDGRMFLIPSEVDGEPTTHTMASEGADVIAAGHVMFGADGEVRRWNFRSGHYRPADKQSLDVADAIFQVTGLKGSGIPGG